MSDLVERLRKWSVFGYGYEASCTMKEAATAIEAQQANMANAARLLSEQTARIQQLEAALREHACGCVDRCMEDREMYGEYTKFENATCSGARARAALGEKP